MYASKPCQVHRVGPATRSFEGFKAWGFGFVLVVVVVVVVVSGSGSGTGSRSGSSVSGGGETLRTSLRQDGQSQKRGGDSAICRLGATLV